MLKRSSIEVFERLARHAFAADPTMGKEAEESCVAILHELVDSYNGVRGVLAERDEPAGCPSCGSVGGAPVGWDDGGVAWMDKRGVYEVFRLSDHDLEWLNNQTSVHEAKGFKTYGIVACKACGATRYMSFKAVSKEAAKNSARMKARRGKGPRG